MQDLVRAREKIRELFAQIDEALKEDEEPLVECLVEAGFDVDSVWDLVNTPSSYSQAVPLLLRYLRSGRYHDRTMEGIVRALTVPEARERGFDTLVSMYEKLEAGTFPDTKDALANAISVLARPKDLDVVIRLAEDARHGTSRVFLVARLKKSRARAATDAVERLNEDPDIKAKG